MAAADTTMAGGGEGEVGDQDASLGGLPFYGGGVGAVSPDVDQVQSQQV